MAEGLDIRVRPHHCILQQAVGSNPYPVTQDNLSLEDGVDVDLNIPAALQLTTNINAKTIHDPYAISHQAIGQTGLKCPLQGLQLGPVVDACYFHGVPGDHQLDWNIALHRLGKGIRQIIFALGVVVVHLCKERPKQFCGCHQHPGVDLFDGALLGTGIGMLDHRRKVAGGVPQHATITRRLTELGREQCRSVSGSFNQTSQGLAGH